MLVVVLGSRTAEMTATLNLIIHGSTAFRLAKVGSGEIEFAPCAVAGIVSVNLLIFLTIIHGILTACSQ